MIVASSWDTRALIRYFVGRAMRSKHPFRQDNAV